MNVYNRPGPSPEPFAKSAQSKSDPMTDDQADLLRELCAEAGITFNSDLTQLEAHEQLLALNDILKYKG